jgi:hypothetical protein
MRIEISFKLRELGLFMAALMLALLGGLVLYGIFALLAFIHWLLAWGAIAIILTPIIYIVFKYFDDDIEIINSDIEITDDF